MLRNLRRIHSHICSVAYPVFDAAGELPTHNEASDLAALATGLSGKAETGLN